MKILFDDPNQNDNRAYDYISARDYVRDEYHIIMDWVQKHSSIIDLGCGDGLLLSFLSDRKNCIGLGYEISASGVAKAQGRGLHVIQKSIDRKHPEISDKQFNYAVCNVTIQMVMYPEILLQEMSRIAKYQIISFPNFAHYRNRLDMLINGRMPRPSLFGYEWYSTGHIHQLSIADFEATVKELGFKILKRVSATHAADARGVKKWFVERFPNLFMTTAIYLLESDQ